MDPALEVTGINWTLVWMYAPSLVALFLILAAVLRALPIWKEVRLREAEVRTKESEVNGQMAMALAGLGTAITGMGTVLEKVAVDQAKRTESTEIMQRVNSDTNDRLLTAVQMLSDRMERHESAHPPVLRPGSEDTTH